MKRLVVADGFVRYYCGFRGSTKPCEWAYMSVDTLGILGNWRRSGPTTG